MPSSSRLLAEKVSETWITTPKRLVSAVKREACLVHIYPTGSTMGCRYPLADHSVSRKHAKIEPADDGYLVSDNHSTNGTFVNDKQLDGPRLLKDGDYLRVGNCLYRYLAGGNIEAEYHEEIYRLTILDGLTQIHNTRYLDEFLSREVVRSQRHNRPLSVLALDIDKFKSINDSLGHLCGDFVLRELAGVVRGLVRQEDLFARSGGEEFVVVLVETTKEGAVQVAERLRQAVADHVFRFEAAPINLTVSIGLATTAGDPTVTPTDLRHEADQKLYEAKRTGRNRVCS